ncbi:MAG: hypothetical protein LBE25_06325 [Arthrobacter sp.]|jgi:hypothetical protein|nr:hypothetical protein [Arthrobacter sp.]
MPARGALAKGDSTDRIAVIVARWESQYCSDQKQTTLALAEEGTRRPHAKPRAWDNGSPGDEHVSATS